MGNQSLQEGNRAIGRWRSLKFESTLLSYGGLLMLASKHSIWGDKEELVSVGEVMVELEKENAVDTWQDAVKILVASEKAGFFSYGKEGLVQPADWKAEGPEVAVNLQPGVHSLPRVCLKELQPWKKAAKIKPFTALSRAAMQRCGLQSLEDEEGDKVQLHDGSGDWLLDQHIDLGWELMKWGLILETDWLLPTCCSPSWRLLALGAQRQVQQTPRRLPCSRATEGSTCKS